jgi:hypothetical protein
MTERSPSLALLPLLQKAVVVMASSVPGRGHIFSQVEPTLGGASRPAPAPTASTSSPCLAWLLRPRPSPGSGRSGVLLRISQICGRLTPR